MYHGFELMYLYLTHVPYTPKGVRCLEIISRNSMLIGHTEHYMGVDPSMQSTKYIIGDSICEVVVVFGTNFYSR